MPKPFSAFFKGPPLAFDSLNNSVHHGFKPTSLLIPLSTFPLKVSSILMTQLSFQISISNHVSHSYFQVSAGQLHLDLPALQISRVQIQTLSFPHKRACPIPPVSAKGTFIPEMTVSLSPLLLPLYSCSQRPDMFTS